jgi:hypothetical protein
MDDSSQDKWVWKSQLRQHFERMYTKCQIVRGSKQWRDIAEGHLYEYVVMRTHEALMSFMSAAERNWKSIQNDAWIWSPPLQPSDNYFPSTPHS